MNVDVKCQFADLKYEQLLNKKYFIETCFSKKYDSYNLRQKLIDILFFMKKEEKFVTYSDGSNCLV